MAKLFGQVAEVIKHTAGASIISMSFGGMVQPEC